MRNNAITQHYWQNQVQVVQPAKEADKPRRDKQGFAAILKAKTTKEERIVFTVIVVWILVIAAIQTCIAAGWITGPVYLADFR